MFKSKKKRKDASKSPKQSISKKSGDDQVLEVIQKSKSPVLLAATVLPDLPVTIPVNLAVSLADVGNCLLIDLDTKRDALAKVFEVDSSKFDLGMIISPLLTEFENLSVWPARYFDLLKQMDLRSLLNTASKKYEYILLYAPYLPVLPDRKAIASCTKQAVVFSKNGPQNTKLHDLLETSNCKILLDA